eukprot:5824070-Amphidinium_carterae.1
MRRCTGRTNIQPPGNGSIGQVYTRSNFEWQRHSLGSRYLRNSPIGILPSNSTTKSATASITKDS